MLNTEHALNRKAWTFKVKPSNVSSQKCQDRVRTIRTFLLATIVFPYLEQG